MSKKDEFAKISISNRDFEREIDTDYNADQAVTDLVFWIFRCKGNNIDVEKTLKYSRSIAFDVEETVIKDMLKNIAHNIIDGNKSLSKEQINELKDNNMYDDFLEILEKLRKEN